MEKECQAHIEQPEADERAADDPHQVGIDGHQRHHDHQREGTGHDEVVDWIDTESFQCVDLLVDLHRADLCCERGAGTARHDDPGHDRSELSNDPEADEIGSEDGSAEFLELNGTDKTEDHADEEADDTHDSEGLDADLLNRHEQVVTVVGRFASKESAKRERQLADEDEAAAKIAEGIEGSGSDSSEEAHLFFFPTRASSFTDCEGQMEKSAGPFWETRTIDGYRSLPSVSLEGDQKGHETGIPVAEFRAVEVDPAHIGSGVELREDSVDRGTITG